MNKKIKISEVSFAYSEITILDKVSFVIENEIAGLLAPTGAGKTTLLNLISGILKPTSGNITINDNSPSYAIKHKKIGFSFQDSTLLEWKSVLENVLLPLQIGRKEKIKGDNREKALELIEVVGLSEVIDFKCSELSGGMKQRVGLARALITNPDIILFDEPFNKLDFVTKSNLLIEFRKILKIRNVCCLIVTHNIEDAVLIADKVLVMSKSPCNLKSEITIPIKVRNVGTQKSNDFIDVVGEIKDAIYNA